MLYLIDSGNINEVNDALKLGVQGVTANTTMYRKNEISLIDFVKNYACQNLSFLSAEVIGDYEEMLKQAKKIHDIHHDIVIKINFSKDGLKLVNTLHKQGIKTAMTLIFTISQAIAAINAGTDYIFFFIGRNEENGSDGLTAIETIQSIIQSKNYKTKLVAASIKNLYQLEKLAALHIDYAAIPYALFMKSLDHPLTYSGAKTFEDDFYLNSHNQIENNK